MKSNKSSLSHREDNENIFENRVFLETVITDITRLGERSNSLEMDQDLIRKSIRTLLKEKTKRAAQRN